LDEFNTLKTIMVICELGDVYVKWMLQELLESLKIQAILGEFRFLDDLIIMAADLNHRYWSIFNKVYIMYPYTMYFTLKFSWN